MKTIGAQKLKSNVTFEEYWIWKAKLKHHLLMYQMAPAMLNGPLPAIENDDNDDDWKRKQKDIDDAQAFSGGIMVVTNGNTKAELILFKSDELPTPHIIIQEFNKTFAVRKENEKQAVQMAITKLPTFTYKSGQETVKHIRNLKNQASWAGVAYNDDTALFHLKMILEWQSD